MARATLRYFAIPARLGSSYRTVCIGLGARRRGLVLALLLLALLLGLDADATRPADNGDACKLWGKRVNGKYVDGPVTVLPGLGRANLKRFGFD